MADLDNAIEKINTAAERTTLSSEFIDDVSTGGVEESFTNPNNSKTVPSLQKQIKALYDVDGNSLSVYAGQAEDARDEAVIAKDAAVNAQVESEDAFAAVEAASDAAIDARNEAVEAQGISETARDESASSRDSAIVASNEAINAKELSESASLASAEAKSLALTAQSESEKARDESVVAKDASETAQAESQASREASETAQISSEEARDESVAAKNEAEAIASDLLYPKNDVQYYGATGTGDESEEVQSAIDYAMDNGLNFVIVNVDFTSNLTLTNRSNVTFIGNGSFRSSNLDTGTYRRPVVPFNATVAHPYLDDNTSIELNKMGDIKIVVTGDSLTTFWANALGSSDCSTQILINKLTNANPDINFTFVGRGIGAEDFTGLDSVATSSLERYDWYTDPDREWLEYIFDEEPDVVIISMGINDQQNLDRASVESVVAKIEAYGAQVMFATNLGVNLSPDATYSGFGTYAGQEGRDYSAGWIRTYCLYHGYPCIDINRTFNLMRDGRDIINTELVETDEEIYESMQAYTAPDTYRCRDYSLLATIDPSGWVNSSPLSVSLSEGASNAVFIEDASGFLRFKFYRGDSDGLYKTVVSDIETPTASVEVEIVLKNNMFSFRIIPAPAGYLAGVQPFTEKVIRYGGLMIPTVDYFGGTGGPVTKATLSMGTEKLYLPAITDIEFFGAPDDGASTRPVTGGNGLNHPASKGIATIYKNHCDVQSFKWYRGVETVRGDQGVCYLYPDGTQRCEATITEANGATIPDGSMFVGDGDSWVYPTPFISTPVIFGSAAGTFAVDVTFNSGSAVANGIKARSNTSYSSSVNLKVAAVGRWKSFD